VSELFTLKNRHGIEARILSYGGIVASLLAPDRNGRFADVVLGLDPPRDYRNRHPFFGALIGRCANRIAQARFTLHGTEYKLAANNGPNSLHGGVNGFDKRVWQVLSASWSSLDLQYVSADGEEGYPGTLIATARYSLTEDNALAIEYSAQVAGSDTVVNLTNHSYFNLSGESGGDVLDHELQINAERFTPIDGTLIPTGELRSVAATPFDFRQPVRIGERLGQDDEQLRCGKGYDHNFALGEPWQMRLAARVGHGASGRVMDVFTDQPELQFYSGNNLNGTQGGKGGTPYQRWAGFCLETQHYPDSPNHPEFPSTLLRPGETFKSATRYQFSTRS